MGKLFFYDYGQPLDTAQAITVDESTLHEISGIVSQSFEHDDEGRPVAYVEDLTVEIEQALSLQNTSPSRIAQVMMCEVITTSEVTAMA